MPDPPTNNPCLPCCCAIGVCCRLQEKQVKALALMMREHAANMPAASLIAATASGDPFDSIAAEMLAHVDLVPKGVGAAIVAAYAPYFAEKAAKAASGTLEQ